jgi:uncharacterized membrane protein
MGTLGGTLLVVIIQLEPRELVKTAVLAAVGAAVSWVVTMGLRWMVKRVRKR